METINKNKWQVRLAALVIFMLGFAAGALTLNLYQVNRSAASPDRMHHRFDQIIERLNLSPDQKTQVEKILGDARAQFRELHKESQPKFDEIRKQVDDRLQAVLTPEQWQKFQQMMKEMKSAREQHWQERHSRDSEPQKP